jgi:hypothetical protein
VDGLDNNPGPSQSWIMQLLSNATAMVGFHPNLFCDEYQWYIFNQNIDMDKVKGSVTSSLQFSPRSIISHDPSDTGDPTSGQRSYPIL